MTVLTENEDRVPLCPHCEEQLTQVVGRTLHPHGGTTFGWGKRYVYSCPSCHKALGISHRKGFWAG